MGKGGSAKQQVNEYNLSIHYGIALQVDALLEILVGEKQAWTGNITENNTFYLDQSNLFGGPKKEGGVRGYVTVLMGGADQVLYENLAVRRDLTSATSPAYRGITSVYFIGGPPGTGFYWGATPFIQAVWFKVKRAPKGLDADYALIGNQLQAAFNTSSKTATIGTDTVSLTDGVPSLVGGYNVSFTSHVSTTGYTVAIGSVVIDFTLNKVVDGKIVPGWTVEYAGSTGVIAGETLSLLGLDIQLYGNNLSIALGTAGDDANPSHIIYECLTNPEWGMGGTDDIIDRAAFEEVAKRLYNEGFGLSIAWTKEDTIESFVNEILDHVQAVLFLDPETGKLTLKLLRNDFDSTSLPTINPDNAVLDNFQRRLWGETINEVVVTWTNPVNEQEETVTYQDLANISIQGDTVSDSRNYHAIRNAALASRVAVRDVNQSSAPLASCEALLDRRSWNLKPGSVIRLVWPEYYINGLVMRVTNIDYGKATDSLITVTLLEDIFSLASADYNLPPDGGSVNTGAAPTPMDLTRIITAPGYFTMQRVRAADASALIYPDVYSAILGATSNTDASGYEILGQTVLANGSIVAEELGTKGLLGYTTLESALSEEASSTVANFGTVRGGVAAVPSVFMFIGNAGERFQEIALIESYSAGTGYVISRGMLDTIPRAWAAGTPVWFYDVRGNFFDPDVHGDTEQVDYKLLTVTSRGRLDYDDAPVQGAVMTGRPHYPNRPANVSIGGTLFGTVDLSGSAPSTVTVTWANRNRTMEDGTLPKWNSGTVAPEAGQTTKITVKSLTGTVLATITGLTGTTYDLPVSGWGPHYDADITVTSERDGFESLMGITRRVRIRAPGYGDYYGGNYGGGVGGEPPLVPPVIVDPTPPYDLPSDFPPAWGPPQFPNVIEG